MQKSSSKTQIWAKRLEEQAKSGINATVWMRDNKISEGEFYYWKRKLKQEIKSEGTVKWQALNFEAPSHNPATVDQKTEEITIKIDTAIITVKKGFDETMLQSVLKIVRL